MSRDHLPEPEAAIRTSGERIAEAIVELVEVLTPPMEPKSELRDLTAAVLEVAAELRGIRLALEAEKKKGG